ncbi:type II toxin-antitoxin system MqsA family antitoxin [Vibrio splendidus]|jgi:HTH-type transcriptional regulator/antitoxin MqsA
MSLVDKKVCPVCGQGTLSRTIKQVEFTYKEHSKIIPQSGEYCDCCGEGILDSRDLKSNKLEIREFHSEVDGLLTPRQIREIRLNLSLKQSEAAAIFGGGKNAFSRYENGELPPPKPLSILLQLLSRHPELLNELN